MLIKIPCLNLLLLLLLSRPPTNRLFLTSVSFLPPSLVFPSSRHRQPHASPTPTTTTITRPNPRMRRQTLIAQHKLAPRPLPRPLIEKDVAPPLRPIPERHGLPERRVLGQPHHELLVVPPVAARELGGGELLHEVARLRVEDPEERLVAEGRDLVAEPVHVVDGVAFREVEVGLEGAGVGFGEGP